MALDPMHVEVFLLVLVRTASWVVAMPYIGGRGIASFGRLALAVSLALFVSGTMTPAAAPTTLGALAVAALAETGIGLALGWTMGLLLHALEAAGSFVDLLGGWSAAALFDPLTGRQNAVFARLNTVTASVLLFVTPAFTLIVRAFVHSFEAVPLGAVPRLDGRTPQTVASAVTAVMSSGLTIAAPVIGALFLVEVGLALASRVVPQANVVFVGLPLRALATLTTVGAMLVLFPVSIERLSERSMDIVQAIVR